MTFLSMKTSTDQSRLHQFGKKVLPGISFGNVLIAVRIWKRDNLVADIEELGNVDVSEIHARRLNAKKFLTPQWSEMFIFPNAEGTAKLSGRDHGAREPALTREQIAVSEDLSEDFQGSSEKFQKTDDTKDGAKARKNFWSIEEDFVYRHHVVDFHDHPQIP